MSYQLQDLLYLMQRLRSPEGGCPWDRAQNFASIVPHTLEEVYEVVDAIEREDWGHLKGELGDLFFQVIFYAQLAQEEGRFDFHDILDALVVKLLRRHPHVFPNAELYQSVEAAPQVSMEEVGQLWEAIKHTERAEETPHQPTRHLADIPTSLPGLTRARKLQKRAAQVGFDWPDPSGVLDKIEEEIQELRAAIASGRQAEIQDEMGDLLFAQVNLCRHLKVDPEQALRSTNRKFERRFDFIEQQVQSAGGDWTRFSLQALDAWWRAAKEQEKKHE